jgi:hypothetical protein
VDETRTPRRILESNVTGKRTIGKPSNKWVNSMKIYSEKILIVRKLKREFLERKFGGAI